MTAPRYQDVKSGDIPEVIDDDGTKVRVIVGDFWGKRGPVDGIAADPQYLDISVPPGVRKTFKVDTYRRAFAYVFAGSGAFADASAPSGVLLEKEVMGQEVNIRDMSGDRTLIRFGTGDEVTVQAGEKRRALFADFRRAIAGTGRLARPDRDEHARRNPPSHARFAQRHLHPACALTAQGGGTAPAPPACWGKGVFAATPHAYIRRKATRGEDERQGQSSVFRATTRQDSCKGWSAMTPASWRATGSSMLRF